jgi:hypothetical protein
LGAADFGSVFGSALGSVFISGLGAGALGSSFGAGLVSALTSGLGAAGLGSALGIALVSVFSSGLGAAALDSTFGAAFGSGLRADLEAAVPDSDFGSTFGAVLVVVDAVDLGVVVLGSALDFSSVRGAVSDLGATVGGVFWAVLDSGVVVVLGAILVVVLAVDLGEVVRGSALDFSSVRGAVSDLGAMVEGVFWAVLPSDEVVLLGAVLDAGVDPVRDVEVALVAVFGAAVIGRATARVFGRPPLALANDALSALAAVMCCV